MIMRPFQGFWDLGEKAYFIFREQGEMAIILREQALHFRELGSTVKNVDGLASKGHSPPHPP